VSAYKLFALHIYRGGGGSLLLGRRRRTYVHFVYSSRLPCSFLWIRLTTGRRVSFNRVFANRTRGGLTDRITAYTTSSPSPRSTSRQMMGYKLTSTTKAKGIRSDGSLYNTEKSLNFQPILELFLVLILIISAFIVNNTKKKKQISDDEFN
jgi:hypothetical protein